VIDPEEFVRRMQDRNLFPGDRTRVVVACSGGPDSVCLLYMLWSCREPLGLELSVLTCDHGLRPESADEAQDVRQRAWMLGLPCALRRLRVEEHQRPGESVEMAARRLRREAYAEVAEEFEADAVALGHHLDDQAETVLMKLIRGTGSRGAGGMEGSSFLTPSVQLVRPLLDYRRSEIEDTLRRWGQPAVLDPTNGSKAFVRNRFRLEVMPLLEEINPGVVRHVAEFAEDQRKLEAWASHEAAEKGKDCLEGEALRLEPWRFLPEVIRERILLGWFRERGGAPEQVSRAAWQDLFADLARLVSHSRRWEVGGLTVQAEGGLLTAGLPQAQLPRRLPVSAGGMECDWLGRRLKMEWVDKVNPEAAGQQLLERTLTAFVRIPDGEFTLRTPEPGDRYRPMGMAGRAKVSDLMINAKIPARLRAVWPVITREEEIVWIPGFRVAEEWKVIQPPCLRLTLTPGSMHTFCG
jgi:tRNA(Ile)-lysidine synthase